MTAISGSEQETVKACPFIGFGLERFCPGALGCQRWSSGPQCFRAEGPCLMAPFRILETTGNWWVFPIRQPWDACGVGWYAPSESGNAVRNPGSSKGSGNEPCRCAKPTAINGMRGFFPSSAACVKCPPPQDRSPSLDLRFRVKRLAGQPAPRRRAQTLKSPPNRGFLKILAQSRKMGRVSDRWSISDGFPRSPGRASDRPQDQGQVLSRRPSQMRRQSGLRKEALASSSFCAPAAGQSVIPPLAPSLPPNWSPFSPPPTRGRPDMQASHRQGLTKARGALVSLVDAGNEVLSQHRGVTLGACPP